ncbi:MAG: hypothetical protein KC486_20470 [Myxococcales bacterium]|nr:hypothetical protein [Myxococcales bacterium]
MEARAIEVLRTIDRGAHAEILAARSRVDGRPLLIKRLHPGLLDYGEDFVDGLVDGVMGRRWPEGTAWLAPVAAVRDEDVRMIVSPWVEVAPLAALLRAGALSAAAVAALGVQLIDALAALGRADPRAIYGELTPAHVLVDRGGGLRIQAACLSPWIHRSGARFCRGILSVILPSMDHWAPERLRGRQEDLRGDLYGVGLLLWRSLGVRGPFAGDSAFARAQAKLSGELPALGELSPETPPEVVEAIASLLARDPEERPSVEAAAAGHLGLDHWAAGGREALARRVAALLDAAG